MSQENVEIVRGLYEKWGKGDLRAGAEFYDSRVLLIPLARLPDSGEALYVGPEGIREFMHELAECLGEPHSPAEEIIEAGDSVVVTARQRGVGKESGVPSELSDDDVWTFRGRAVVRREHFANREGRPRSRGAVGAGRSRRLLNRFCEPRYRAAYAQRSVKNSAISSEHGDAASRLCRDRWHRSAVIGDVGAV